MIFVVTGTHEQPFDRLVAAADRVGSVMRTAVLIQSGTSSVSPSGARHVAYLPFNEMESITEAADAVITHGGPGSVLLAVRHGKVPIVVPRQRRFGEHVDDHQVAFGAFLRRERVAVVIDGLVGDALVSALSSALSEARSAPVSRTLEVAANRAVLYKALESLCAGSLGR